MTILSRDSVFVYQAQQTIPINEVEIAMELDSSVPLVRQRLRDLGDAVETDGDGNWCIKTEQEQRCLTWTNDNRYVWCDGQSEKEIEEVTDRSLLLKELEKLHNLRQELFLRARNTFDELKKNNLSLRARDKVEPPIGKPRDSHLDSYLDTQYNTEYPRQNAVTGLFNHGRTDRNFVVLRLIFLSFLNSEPMMLTNLFLINIPQKFAQNSSRPGTRGSSFDRKDKQIAWVKQKLDLSETDNYEIELYICFIRRDGGTQPRAAIDENTVDEYAEAMGEGTKFPPVTVFFDGEFWLADGFHRVKAAEKIGLLKVTVEVKQGSLRDAVLYSCGANATHGLRRSNVDKRRAVLRLLEDREWSQWSDRYIARRCGVYHQMVGRLRSSLDESSSERKYTTKHGTTATMKTEKIGKTESITAKQQKENQSTIKESLDLKKAKNKSIKHKKKEGLNYQPGLGCEWYVKIEQETYEKIKDYQARLGIATLDRVINELLDLAQNTNKDD